MQLLAPLRRRSRCLLAQSQTDADAYADFYDAYSERILKFTTRRVLDVDLAFDLMSETFALALERRHQFRGESQEEEQGWLFAIARTVVLQYWRRGSVEREAMARLSIEPPALTDRDLERLEEMAGVQVIVTHLRSALDLLSDEQRRAVEARVIDGESYGALAMSEAVTEEVVRARVSRGLRTLAKSLNEQGVFAEDVV